MNLDSTIYNTSWLYRNEKAICLLLPETWTHVSKVNGLRLGFQLKVMGVDWRNDADFAQMMSGLEEVGLVLREGHSVRRKN